MRSLKSFVMVALALGMVTAAQAELQNVEVGGSIRIRGNYYNWDNNVAINAGEDQAFVEQRTRLNFKADFTDDVSTFVELDSYDNWGEDFRSNYITGLDFRGADNVDLYQAYIQIKNAWGLPITTKIGRQEIELGSEWLIGNQDASSLFTGLSFDGIRTTYATDSFTVDLLSMKLSENFQDFAKGDVNLYGIYGSYIGLEDWQFDLYWLYVMEHESDRRFAPLLAGAGTGVVSVGLPGTPVKDVDLHTIGLRGAGTYGAFDLEAEVAFQFGSIDHRSVFLSFVDQNQDYNAWAFNLEAGYTFDMTWTPRVYLGAAFFEGGDQGKRNNFWDNLFGRNNNDLGFNRLFSNWEYSEFLENTDLSNCLILRGGISAMPTEKISLLLALSYFDTDQTVDNFRFLWWNNNNNGQLGWELGLYGDYKYSEDLTLRAGFAHFFGDNGLNDGNFVTANGLGRFTHVDRNRNFWDALFNRNNGSADYNYLYWEAEISF